MALYAFLVTAITARYTKLLPTGMWLKIHRLSLLVWVFAWLHAVLAGTDSGELAALYVGTGLAIVGSGAYRYWASRQRRPTFITSRPEVEAP
jgi:DMSO/TMAO reductase YedYZ heme-binding membrane subunit